MIDSLTDIRKTIGNFNKGLITRIDDRDASENSLANVYGFTITQKIGRLVKDSGSSAYFSSTPLPSDMTDVFGVASFVIPRTGKEYVVLFGQTVSGYPKFWIRGKTTADGTEDTYWVELTEKDTGTILTDTSATAYDVSGLSNANSDWYKGWIIYNSTRNDYAYVTSDIYTAGNHSIVTNESHSAWAVSDTLVFFRFPDTKKLLMDSLAVGSSQHFFANRLQDRLCIGWQRSAPTKDEPLCVEYIQRGIFHSGSAHLLNLDEIYFGREIPDYATLSEAGVEIFPNITASNSYAPDTDVTTTSWNKSSGSAAYYTYVDETTPDDSDYLYTDVSVSSTVGYVEGSPLVLEFATAALPAKGSVRMKWRMKWENVSFSVDWAKFVRVEILNGSTVLQNNIYNVLDNWATADLNLNIESAGIGSSSIDFRLKITPYMTKTLARALAGSARFMISWERLDVTDLSASNSTELRLIYVPMYNGYMLGRPVMYKYQILSTGATYYPQLKVDLTRFDRRMTDIFVFSDDADAELIPSLFNSAFHIKIASTDGISKRGTPYGVVARWSFDSSLNVFKTEDNSSDVNTPEALSTGRDVTQCVLLKNLLGYAVPNPMPSVGVKWRYQAQSSFKQNAQVFVDESDDVLRLSNYSDKIHNDHVFVDVNQDNASNPLKIFLTSKGELYGILGQLGKIYVFKRPTLEVIDATTGRSQVYEADIIAKKSIIFTSIGIVFAGKTGIYVMPLHGGMRETISDAIFDEYIAIAETYKQNMVAAECKERGVIMFTIQKSGTVNTQGDYSDIATASYETYCYHTEMNIWWKRIFYYTPRHFTQLSDNSVLFATRDTAKLLKYPDTIVNTDAGQGIPWRIETQWLMGDDVQKILRTVVPQIMGDTGIRFQIDIYFDRKSSADASPYDVPFDSLYGTTVARLFETPLPVKHPNQWKEVKFIIHKNDADSDLTATGNIQFLGMSLYGETLVTGKEN